MDGNTAVFRRSGRNRVLAFAGAQGITRERKGYRAIERLLACPGVTIPVAELLAVMDMVVHRRPSGSMGDMIDEEALDAYRARGRELLVERQDAQARGNQTLLQEIEEEIASISAMVNQTTGWCGRRRSLSDEDRVRVNVTMTIRRCIWSIARVHQALADHLKEFIRTGRNVAYLPAKPIPWNI